MRGGNIAVHWESCVIYLIMILVRSPKIIKIMFKTVKVKTKVEGGRLRMKITETKKYNTFGEVPGAHKLVRDVAVQSLIIKKSRDFDESSLNTVYKSK